MNIKCQKCINLRSNYRLPELEMCLSCTQWLPKPSHKIQVAIATSNVNSRWVFSSKPPDTYKAIRILYEKQELVWKNDIVPLLHSALSFSAPFSLCFVKGSCSNGRGADSPRRYKHRRTVRADTGCAENMPIFWLMLRAVAVQFCSAYLISLFPGPLVIGGRWDPACRLCPQHFIDSIFARQWLDFD